MQALELLAPARNKEIGIAAIDCGADAVYIAGPEFGARQAAGNPVGDIADLCRYAHRFGVRIFVTLNTILYEDELPRAESLIREAGFSKGIFVYDDSEWESDYALEKICKAISVAFGVSFTAAKIHLKELGLLMKANRYNTPQALQAV